MLDKTIRILYYSLFLVTPLLMLASTSELFEFNKMLFIYFVALGVLFVWFLRMFKEKRFFIGKTLLDIPILIFLGSQVLSTLFSIDRHTSLFGYYGRFNGGLVSLLAYLIIFYGFVTLFDKKNRERLMKWSLLSSFLVILWGLPGRFGHDLSCLLYTGQFNNICWTDQFRPAERMFSTLGQPNWLGAYLAVNFFIGLYFFLKSLTSTLKKHDYGWKIIYGGYLILNFCGILFSRSRSAILATAVGLVIFFILIFTTEDGKKLLKSLIKPLGLLFIAFLVAIIIFKTGIERVDNLLSLKKTPGTPQKTNSVTKEPQLSSEITESLDIRKIVWKGAFELGKKYPLFGTGVETFAYSYYFVRPIEHNLTSEWDYLYNKAHNEYLNYLATTGFIGLGSYLALIVMVGLVFYKKILSIGADEQNNKLLLTALFSSYITILITNFFGFSTTTINLFFYILIPGILVGGKAVLSLNLSRKVSFYSFIAVNAVLLYLFVNLALYLAADINYSTGTNYAKVGNYQQAAKYLNNALTIRYEHVYEDKYSYYLANLAFAAAYYKQPKLVDKWMSAAVFYNNRTLKSSSKNVNYWKTRGKNDYLFYQINLDKKYLEDGVKALNQAQVLAPTDPKLPYSLSIYYSLLNDDAAQATEDSGKKAQLYKTLSLSNIEKAISLKEDYRDAYLLQAQLLKKYGETEKAKRPLEYILKKLNSQDEEASQELKSL